MSIKYLECDFVVDINRSYTLESTEDGVGIYVRYISDLESEQILLADLWMVVEIKMEKIKDKYCAYE